MSLLPVLAVPAVLAVLAVLPLLATLAVLVIALNLAILAHLATLTRLPEGGVFPLSRWKGGDGRGGQGVRGQGAAVTNPEPERSFFPMSRKRLLIPILLLAAVLAAGCTTLTTLTRPLAQATTTLFTSTTLADLQLIGVKTGPLLPIQAGPLDTTHLLGEDTTRDLTDHLGQTPLGVLLPITRIGETTPWWIFCPAGDLQKRCEEIPSNARVTFTGRPLRGGLVLLPTRLTWSAR